MITSESNSLGRQLAFPNPSIEPKVLLPSEALMRLPAEIAEDRHCSNCQEQLSLLFFHFALALDVLHSLQWRELLSDAQPCASSMPNSMRQVLEGVSWGLSLVREGRCRV